MRTLYGAAVARCSSSTWVEACSTGHNYGRRVYIKFDNVPKADALLGKLQELHAAMASSGAQADAAVFASLVQWCEQQRSWLTSCVDSRIIISSSSVTYRLPLFSLVHAMQT